MQDESRFIIKDNGEIMKSVDIEVRVRYSETDQMGIVYYANYFVWFEVGRVEWLRSRDISYKELEEKGILFPVVEAQCQYKYPAKYDDLLIIRTKIKERGRLRFSFEYEIFKKDDMKLMATGYTTHIAMNKEGKAIKLSNDIIKMT